MPAYFTTFSINKKGFTLVELLVAISIIVIVGTLALIDFGPFREGQNLQTAALNLQNFIREAQVNASSGVVCPDDDTVKPWKIKLERDKVRIICGDTGSADRILNLKKEVILYSLATRMTDDKTGILSFCGNYNDLQILFMPITGAVSFAIPNTANCASSNPLISVKQAVLSLTLQDDPGSKKDIIISSGGVISVE